MFVADVLALVLLLNFVTFPTLFQVYSNILIIVKGATNENLQLLYLPKFTFMNRTKKSEINC